MSVKCLKENGAEYCYLCGTQLRACNLGVGESPPPDFRTRDHVPPAGLFPSPKPNNLIAVPCCFRCNNQHSGFDERLRLVAAAPFDRNQAGQQILDEKVVGGTLAKGRQIQFIEKLLASMQPLSENPALMRMRMDAHEFHEGMVRITKGLLFTLYPEFDYQASTFHVIDIHPKPSAQQSNLIGMLMRAQYFERGEKAFQCWSHVDKAKGSGAWMLAFYECFGFFVIHANGSGLDRFRT